jgi:hypothetical protein
LPLEVEEYNGFDFASLALLFWILFWSFKIFSKKEQGSSNGYLDRSSGICYLTNGF